jgi:hypothetical protein
MWGLPKLKTLSWIILLLNVLQLAVVGIFGIWIGYWADTHAATDFPFGLFVLVLGGIGVVTVGLQLLYINLRN